MTERNCTHPAAGNGPTEKLDEEFISAEARPVCPNCLNPCSPWQNYCGNCDSNEVVNPLASYMPFVDIRFTCGFFGKMWRKTWYDKEASTTFRLLCLFLMVLFAPILLLVGLPLFLLGKIAKPELQRTIVAGFFIIAAVLLMIVIYLNIFRGAISPVGIR
jgi:hypothetical protein